MKPRGAKVAPIPRHLGEVLTVEQFLRLPEVKPALEFVGGRVIQKMSPKTSHSILQTFLSASLLQHAWPRKLGQPYIELRCTFGGESLVPDISYIERGRIPKGTDGLRVEDVMFPPDLAIEVISNGQTIKNLSMRIERAIREGVRLAWLIQPGHDRVFVFRPDQPVEILGRDGTLSGEAVVPGFTLPVAEIFGWLSED